MFWEQYSHEPYIAVRIARLHYLKTPAEDLDPKLLTRGNEALARMELQLSDTSYLAGEAVSLADIALVAYTRKARMGGYTLSDYVAVVQWIGRVERALNLPPIDAPV
jgi:glutathione S-transferase